MNQTSKIEKNVCLIMEQLMSKHIHSVILIQTESLNTTKVRVKKYIIKLRLSKSFVLLVSLVTWLLIALSVMWQSGCLLSANKCKIDHNMDSYVFFLLLGTFSSCFSYEIDDSKGLGRRFDGIGGLSGGGVRLYINVLFKTTSTCVFLYRPLLNFYQITQKRNEMKFLTTYSWYNW